MTQTSDATKLPVGLRKAYQWVRSYKGLRTDLQGYRLIFEVSEAYPDGMGDNVLLGFNLPDSQHVRVEVWFDAAEGSESLVLRAFGRRNDDYAAPVMQQITKEEEDQLRAYAANTFNPDKAAKYVAETLSGMETYYKGVYEQAQRVETWPESDGAAYFLDEPQAFPVDLRAALESAAGITRKKKKR